MKNMEIRVAILKNNLCHWQLAEALNVGEFTFSRWLRNELPREKKALVLEAINNLSKGERSENE